MDKFESFVDDNLTELKAMLSNPPLMSVVLDKLPLDLRVKLDIYNTFDNNHDKGVRELIATVAGSSPKVKEKFIERIKALRPDLFPTHSAEPKKTKPLTAIPSTTGSSSSSSTTRALPSKKILKLALEMYKTRKVIEGSDPGVIIAAGAAVSAVIISSAIAYLAIRNPDKFIELIRVAGTLSRIGKNCWYFEVETTEQQEWSEIDITELASKVLAELSPTSSFPSDMKVTLQQISPYEVPSTTVWLSLPQTLPDNLSNWKKHDSDIIKYLGYQLSACNVSDEQLKNLFLGESPALVEWDSVDPSSVTNDSSAVLPDFNVTGIQEVNETLPSKRSFYSQNHNTYHSRWMQAFWLSLLPWWLRMVVVPLLHKLVDGPGLKVTTFSDIVGDLHMLWAIPTKYWRFLWSILGIPPDEAEGNFIKKMMSWGSAPNSEVRLQMRFLFLEIPYLVFLDFVGLIFVIISFIPVVCALYPLYTCLTVKGTEIIAHDDSMHRKHQDEKWFFINGSMSSRYTAHKNALRLSKLIRRPITLVYNPTQGIVTDLVKCLFSRTLHPIFPALAAHKLIEAAIMDKDVTRVSVVGHGQGCLISAEILKYITKDYKQREASEYNNLLITNKHLQKLEVYLFASPAAEVQSINHKVHIEHFANESDFVALLGVLSPIREELAPNAADPRWVFIRNRNGHLLNEHYLRDWDSLIFPYKPLLTGNTNRSRLEELIHNRYSYYSSAKTKSQREENSGEETETEEDEKEKNAKLKKRKTRKRRTLK
eukprot:TRINITY_DN4500_c0_g1_i2.p1 TRINITY_DN4500_c0_g1~~TRINITY_DN4500_c0_g1_i2.p1  ORF type:complete len:764 (+),score=96.03 TRINITY_DN4500_c0_g1_i2:67-2358(+)